jgi:hypothetical protein
MRHRLIESLLRENVLIPNFRIVRSSPTMSSFPKRKGARIGKTSCSPLPTPTRFPKLILLPKPNPVPKPIPVPTSNNVLSPIDYMPKFMVPFIEKIMDVKGERIVVFRL